MADSENYRIKYLNEANMINSSDLSKFGNQNSSTTTEELPLDDDYEEKEKYGEDPLHKTERNGKNEVTTHYNEDGTVSGKTEIEYEDENSYRYKSQAYYDGDGKQVFKTDYEYKDDGSHVEHVSWGNKRDENVYGADGKLTQTTTYNDSDNTKRVYKYDNDLQKKSYTEYDSNGNAKYETYYDSDGNKVNEKYFDVHDGKYS